MKFMKEIVKKNENLKSCLIFSMYSIPFKNNKRHHQVKSVKREIHLLINEILKLFKC